VADQARRSLPAFRELFAAAANEERARKGRRSAPARKAIDQSSSGRYRGDGVAAKSPGLMAQAIAHLKDRPSVGLIHGCDSLLS